MSAVVSVSPATMASVPPPSVSSPAAASMGDERDLFISWLRAEFAAANAIIDLLLSHLRLTGGPGKYEHVAASIQQRRAHWVPLIHLQQYFPVADVAIALQHSAWRCQQGTGPAALTPPQHQSSQALPRGGRRHGMNGMSYEHGNDHGFGFNNRRYFHNNRSDWGPTRENNATISIGCGGSSEEGSGVLSEANSGSKERERETLFESESCKATNTDENHVASHRDGSSENGSRITSNAEEKKPIPKEYVSNEIIDGARMVNALEGLKIYEELVDSSDAKKILSWANETRDKGRRGELQGQTFIVGKRPNRGHGREVIQLGIPVLESSPVEEHHTPAISRERKVEAIPGMVQDMLDQLVHLQVIPFRPDYCTIDFFNEGDHSHPNTWPSCYGRPVCTLCLTTCDMVFGRQIMSDYKGDHRGPLSLSLSPGDVVVLRGKGAEMVKRAIPSMYKQRVVLTFGKFQARRNPSFTCDPNSSSSSPSPWNPHPSARSSPNHHLPRPNGPNPKHYAFEAPQAVTPAPVPVPMPVVIPLTQAPPHPLAPGTGVFLPPPPPPPPINTLPENLQPSGEPLNSKPNGTVTGTETANPVISDKDEVKHEGDCTGTADADSGAK